MDQRREGLRAGGLRGPGLSPDLHRRVTGLVAALDGGEIPADLLVQRDGSRCWSWREDGLRRELTLGLEGEAELLEGLADGRSRTTIAYADGTTRVFVREPGGAMVELGDRG